MKVILNKTSAMGFTARTESGHSVLMDASAEVGGENKGSRPMEMLLMGLGGCSAIDVVMILKKSRQKVNDCRLEISAERATTDPKVFTNIHLHFIVEGENINSLAVAKAIALSAEKYCSASIMLGKVAKITHDFEMVSNKE